jgi:antitoxin VapB
MIYTISIYHLGFIAMTKTTAKLFMHGRSQAVRLPKEFRLPGKEVEVSREGDAVTLRPIKQKTRPTDWSKFWAEIDSLGEIDDSFLKSRTEGLLPQKDKPLA